MSSEQVLSTVNELHARLLKNRRVVSLLFLLVAISYLALAITGASQVSALAALTALILGFVIVAYALTSTNIFRRPSRDSASSLIDLRYNLKNRALTLMELKQSGEADPRIQLIAEQVAPHLSSINPAELAPLNVPKPLKYLGYSLPLVWVLIAYLLLRTPEIPPSLAMANKLEELLEARGDSLPDSVKSALQDVISELQGDTSSGSLSDAIASAQSEIARAEAELQKSAENQQGANQPDSKSTEQKDEQAEQSPGKQGGDESQEQQEQKSESDAKGGGGEGKNNQEEKEPDGGKQGGEKTEQGDKGQEQKSPGGEQGNSPDKQGGEKGSEQQKGEEKQEQGGGKPDKKPGDKQQGGQQQGGAQQDGKQQGDKQQSDKQTAGSDQGQDQKQDKEQQAGEKDGAQQPGKGQERDNKSQGDKSGESQNKGEGEKGEQPGNDQKGQKGKESGKDSQALNEAKEALNQVQKAQENAQNQGESPNSKAEAPGGGGDETKSETPQSDQPGESKNPEDKKGDQPGRKGDPNASKAKDTGKSDSSASTDQQAPALQSQDTAERFGKNPTDGSGSNKPTDFEETQIGNPDEKFDTRYTGKESNRELNQDEAQLKTKLSDVELAKPDPVRNEEDQPIPLEYKDLMR